MRTDRCTELGIPTFDLRYPQITLWRVVKTVLTCGLNDLKEKTSLFQCKMVVIMNPKSISSIIDF